MLLIVPLTTNLANVLLRSHDFELVQTVSAKKNHYSAFQRHNIKGISPVHFVSFCQLLALKCYGT